MPEETTVPQVYAAIAAVTRDIGKIAKDGKGPQAQGSFPFMPVESIIEALNPLLLEHGLVMRENVLHTIRETDEAKRALADGTPTYDGRVPTIRVRVEQTIEWNWIALADGSVFPVTNVGEAHDVADKAVRKANTAAYKEMLLRTFAIVAGEKDPDSIDPNEEEANQAERRNRGQQKVDGARPTAGRTRARATPAPKVPAPEPEAAADAPPLTTPAAATPPAETSAPAAPAPEATAEAGFAPDPADVEYAEQHAPAAPAAAPVAAVPATTATEKRGENISALKNDLRRAWSARGMTRDDVNNLGRKLFSAEPSVFLFNATQLKTLMKAVEAGEMA